MGKLVCYSDGGMNNCKGMYGSFAVYDVGDGRANYRFNSSPHYDLAKEEPVALVRSTYKGDVSSNNVAEALSLLSLMRWLKEKGYDKSGHAIEIYLDSELVCNWILGVYQIKKVHIKRIFDIINSVFDGEERKNITFWHIPGSVMKNIAIGH